MIEESYSGKFGTFMTDCEKMRKEVHVAIETKILQHRHRKLHIYISHIKNAVTMTYDNTDHNAHFPHCLQSGP